MPTDLSGPIAVLDVHYMDDQAAAACVVVDDWPDELPSHEAVEWMDHVEPYQPGSFFRRELPCLLAVLRKLSSPPSLVVIDGYAWLDGDGRRGLGAHLHDALDPSIPVVGVAKSRFAGAGPIEVLRGASRSPLFVTAAGVDPGLAAEAVRRMHGPHRIPTVLKRVDRLCRDASGHVASGDECYPPAVGRRG